MERDIYSCQLQSLSLSVVSKKAIRERSRETFKNSSQELLMAASSVDEGCGSKRQEVAVNEDEDCSCYKPGHSMAGILYSSAGIPNFKSLHSTADLRSPLGPSFLRAAESATMYSSSLGLVLYSLDNSNSSTPSSLPADCYHIHNPFPLGAEQDVMSHASSSIPPTHRDPYGSPLTALALVVDGPVFHIVRARCKFSGLSYYHMDEYSSATGEWRRCGEFNLAPDIVPNTAVSCGRKAYWLVKSSAVIEHNTTNHRARIFLLPWQESTARSLTPHPGPPRQLGRAGKQLCFVLGTALAVEVYLLERGDKWTLYHKVAVNIVSIDGPLLYSGGRENPIVCLEKPQPIRFESFKIEVPLWVDGRLVVVEDGRVGNPPADHLPERIRVVPFREPAAAPDCVADCLPLVSTSLLPGPGS